jgi:hypothetical protein
MSIEAMKQAVEVLEQINKLSIGDNAIALPGEIDAAMDNLRYAIEQAEKPEPVAWMYDFLSDNRDEVIRNWVTQSQDDITRENGFNVRPLYTSPREWVELTDDEARALVNRATFGDKTNWQALVYMIDAKLKEKNDVLRSV